VVDLTVLVVQLALYLLKGFRSQLFDTVAAHERVTAPRYDQCWSYRVSFLVIATGVGHHLISVDKHHVFVFLLELEHDLRGINRDHGACQFVTVAEQQRHAVVTK